MIIITDSYASRNEVKCLHPSFSRLPSQNYEIYAQEHVVLACILTASPASWAAITAAIYTQYQREQIVFLMTDRKGPPLLRIHHVHWKDKEFFPDILEHSPVPETDREDERLTAGYEAASLFLGPHAIYCFSTYPPLDDQGKTIVADLMQQQSLSLQRLIQQSLASLSLSVSTRHKTEKKLYQYYRTHFSFPLPPEVLTKAAILSTLDLLEQK